MPIALRRTRSTLAFCLVVALSGCMAGRPAADREPLETDHVVVGELRGRTGAYLAVLDAASRVQVSVAALPGQLYRISTPAGAGLTPLTGGRDGRVAVRLRPTGGDGPDDVRVVLNRDVRWSVSLPAGAGEQQLDLAAGRVSRVDLGPSGVVELRLPRPSGTLPVTLAPGVGAVVMTVGGAPVRMRLAGGADAVDTPWTVRDTAPSLRTLQEQGWPTARNRYEVEARAALGDVSLSRVTDVDP